MSVLPSKADMLSTGIDVRLVPKADVLGEISAGVLRTVRPLRLDLLFPDLMDAESDAGELVNMSLVLDLHSCLIRLGRC